MVPIYVAHCLNVTWKTFIPTILRYCLATVVMIGIYWALTKFIIVDNILMLLISVAIAGIIGLVVNYIVLFDKSDKHRFISIIKNRFKKS